MATTGGSAAREIFARFGVEFDREGNLQRGEQGVDGLADRLRGLGDVIAGGAVVLGIRAFVEEVTEASIALDNNARALGLSTDALQAWRAAAGAVGVTAEQITPAIQALRRNADAAAHGGAGMAHDLRLLGISAAEIRGPLQDTDALLMRVAEGAQAVEDPTQRAAVLMRLMGEQGARLGPLFDEGAAGVARARAELAELGGGISEDAIAASRDLANEQRRLDLVLTSLRSRIALYVLPAVERLTSWAVNASATFVRLSDRGRLLEATMVAIGVAAAAAGARPSAAWLAAALPIVALIAAVGLLSLVLEDLWFGFTTGESAIGDLGVAIEEWSSSVAAEDGPIHAVGLAFEYVKGIIVSTVDTIMQMGVAMGLLDSNPLGNITGEIGNEGDPESALAQEISDRRRESMGAGEFLIPDSFERFAAVDEARRQIRDGTAPEALAPGGYAATSGGGRPVMDVDMSGMTINADGLSGPEAQRVIEGAVQRALTSSYEDSIDTMGTGVA
jgi:hypothetical protein